MQIARKLTLCAVASTLLAAGQCSLTTSAATETERARCEALKADLPTRSHSDTEQTQAELARFYDVFAAVCPGY